MSRFLTSSNEAQSKNAYASRCSDYEEAYTTPLFTSIDHQAFAAV